MNPQTAAGVLLVLVGAGFLLVSGLVLWRGWRSTIRSRRWAPVQAQVESVRVERRRQSGADGSQRSRYVSLATYHYTDPGTGRQYEGTGVIANETEAWPGSTLDVVVDPDDPSRSALPGGSIAGTTCLTVFLLLFVVVGLVTAALGVAVLR